MAISPFLLQKTLLNTVIATCILAAITALVQLWFSPFDDEIFWKLLITYGLVACTTAALKAIGSDSEDAGEKRKDHFLVGTVLVAAIASFMQLWFSLLAGSIFGKLLVTCCVIIALISIIRAVKSDLDDEGQKKKDNYFN